MNFLRACAALAITLNCGAAYALDNAALEEGAALCLAPMAENERTHNLPPLLLEAIATIETGQRERGRKIAFPWPWTINAHGKGYYLRSKEEAVEKAQEFQRHHVRNMAVGCMQVNVSSNKKAFKTLDEAFDPAHNVAYAARVLKQSYDDEGAWRKAVAAYHTGDSETGGAYAQKVYRLRARLMAAGRKHGGDE